VIGLSFFGAMKSPFPGMDPFIEARGLWPDFHQRLMGRIADLVSQALPPQYVARLGHRTYIDRISDDLAGDETHFEPDVSLLQRGGPSAPPGGGEPAEVKAGAVIMHAAPSGSDTKEVYLDIFDLDPDRRLVTSIEVLSPANKRFRGTGWKQYARKRDLLLQGRANLVELDLLRGGRRHAMQEPWPDSPYYILVSKKWNVPACHVWPAYAIRPLPELEVPLERNDAELRIPLQECVDAVFAASRYGEDVRYDEPIVPLLSREESQLVTQATRGP
jgi:Protein of unknown function (DUF4058)